MTRRLLAALFAAVLLPVVGGLASPAYAAAGDYVAGRGTIYGAGLCSEGYGARFHLAFNGTGPGSGATGTWTFACEDPAGATISGTAECLTVYGTTATREGYAGGIVTASTASSYPTGSGIGFRFGDDVDLGGGRVEDMIGVAPSLAEVECDRRVPNYYGTFGGSITAGSAAADTDNDGFLDPADNCPSTANPGQADADGDDRGDACDANPNDGPDGDLDGDGLSNYYDFWDYDPCRPNAGGSPDADGDGLRDVCDADDNDGPAGDLDGDGTPNGEDADDTDGPAGDSDSDGVVNGTDNCPGSANAGQVDADGDGAGDVCDADDNDGPAGDLDGDGTPNGEDADDTDGPAGDTDSDGVVNGTDNCPGSANAGQVDTDGDGTGDACDSSPNGSSPAPTCAGEQATIFVRDGVIVGGPDAGRPYSGALRGSGGDDVIVGTNAADDIVAGDGDDLVCALAGYDEIIGNAGNDRLLGFTGNDVISGGAGADNLQGRVGNDTLTGGNQADRFLGGPGTDRATDFSRAEGDRRAGIP